MNRREWLVGDDAQGHFLSETRPVMVDVATAKKQDTDEEGRQCFAVLCARQIEAAALDFRDEPGRVIDGEADGVHPLLTERQSFCALTSESIVAYRNRPRVLVASSLLFLTPSIGCADKMNMKYRHWIEGGTLATSKELAERVMDALSLATGGNVSSRPMMGEYVIYFHDKIIGGIYDDRLLVKPTASACTMLPEAPMELPYEGAKEMLCITDFNDLELISQLFDAVYDELPKPKPRKDYTCAAD